MSIDEEQAEVDALTRLLDAGPRPTTPTPIESTVSDLRHDECADATSGWSDEAAG